MQCTKKTGTHASSVNMTDERLKGQDMPRHRTCRHADTSKNDVQRPTSDNNHSRRRRDIFSISTAFVYFVKSLRVLSGEKISLTRTPSATHQHLSKIYTMHVVFLSQRTQRLFTKDTKEEEDNNHNRRRRDIFSISTAFVYFVKSLRVLSGEKISLTRIPLATHQQSAIHP